MSQPHALMIAVGSTMRQLYLLQKLLALRRLLAAALWQNNGQEMWFFCTQGASDNSGICPCGAGCVDMVVLFTCMQ